MSIYTKDTKWDLYMGIMTETTSYRNQRKFNIYIAELAPFAEGDIQPELFENKVEIENVYTGKTEQGKVTVSKNVIADYFGTTSSLDVPTMYKGQQVLVLNYGHNDRWYWLPLERDDHLKTFEHYRIHCNDLSVTNKVPDAGSEDIEKKHTGITDDNSYFFEIDTKYKKMIRFRTANTDGEDFRYYFEVDAEAHTIKLWDEASDTSERTTPNQILIESRQPNPAIGTPPHGRITVQTADNCSIIMDNVDMTIDVPRNLHINVGHACFTSIGPGGNETHIIGPNELKYDNTLRMQVLGDTAINLMSRLGLRIIGLIQSIFDTTLSASIGVPGFQFDEKTGPKPGIVNIMTTANVNTITNGNVVKTINGALNTTITATESRTVNKKVVINYADDYMLTAVKNVVHNFNNYWIIGANWNVSYPVLNAAIGKVNVGVAPPPPITVTMSAGPMAKSVAPKKDPTGTAEGDAPSATPPNGDAFQISFANGIKADIDGGQEISINGDAITNIEGIAESNINGSMVKRIEGGDYTILNGDRIIDINGTETINANGEYTVNAEGKMTYNLGGDLEVNGSGNTDINLTGTTDITSEDKLTVTVEGESDITYNAKANITYTTDRTETIEGNVEYVYKQDKTETYEGNYTLEVTGDHVVKVDGNITQEIGGDLTETVEGKAEYTFNSDLTTSVKGAKTSSIGGTFDETVKGDVTIKHEKSTTFETNSLITKITSIAKLITTSIDVATDELVDSLGGILKYLEGIEEPPWPPAGGASGEDTGESTEE